MSHTVGENLIIPAAKEIIQTLIPSTSHYVTSCIPLSNDTKNHVASPVKRNTAPEKETEKRVQYSDGKQPRKEEGASGREHAPWLTNDVGENIFYPFGTPGGGNPNFDKDGNRIIHILGPSTVRRNAENEKKKEIAAQLYSNHLRNGMLERQLNDLEEKRALRSPAKSIVDQMRSAPGGQPRRDPNTGMLVDQHLNSSDVTHRHNISPRHWFTYTDRKENPLCYSTELERQAQYRKLNEKLNKMQDEVADVRHCEIFSEKFGRNVPGSNLKKGNLNNMLFYPETFSNVHQNPSDNNTYHLPQIANDANNYIGPYHANNYEWQDSPHDLYLKNVSPRSPYALHNN